MEALVPPAIASLRAHFGTAILTRGAPACASSSLPTGPAPAPTTDDAALPDTLTDVRALRWRELQVVAARLLGELPSAERDIATTNVAPVVVTNGTVE